MGSGPAAESGDEVSVYYAGARYGASRPSLAAWPPSFPTILLLGSTSYDVYEDAWEEAIEGMRVGGLRQAIIPWHPFNGDPAPFFEYVFKLVALEQDPEKP